MVVNMFSLVLPVYNEEENLSRNFYSIKNELSKTCKDFEIIIAEDGSTDQTYALAKEILNKNKNVTIIHSDKKLGRGKALKNAFRISKGNKVGYMDIDMATDISFIKRMIKELETYDVVTGSRLLKKELSNRKMIRYFLSRIYNLNIRIFFGSRIKDHQCGFKGFRKEVIQELNKLSIDNHWFWDSEILIIAQKKGYSVLEFPVKWIESKKSKVRIKRDVLYMGTRLIKLFVRLNLL
jgi:glycosyltransferase involved in cell wall biosynthesis